MKIDDLQFEYRVKYLTWAQIILNKNAINMGQRALVLCWNNESLKKLATLLTCRYLDNCALYDIFSLQSKYTDVLLDINFIAFFPFITTL